MPGQAGLSVCWSLRSFFSTDSCLPREETLISRWKVGSSNESTTGEETKDCMSATSTQTQSRYSPLNSHLQVRSRCSPLNSQVRSRYSPLTLTGQVKILTVKLTVTGQAKKLTVKLTLTKSYGLFFNDNLFSEKLHFICSIFI